ncbi:diguanylate cyclase [Sulfurimonas sp. HSL3-7]|uniref:GGDEF domain-containing protein n=1 Tax=Sulfonitrofixus jiaomeiensis TaxID=3131938 RepID=UPI0031FA3186
MSILFPEKPSTEIKNEQVRLLYQQGSMIQLMGIFIAVVSAMLFWNVADHTALLMWLAVVVLVLFTRLLINERFLRVADDDFDADKWEKIYSAGTFASGVAWGAFALFYEPQWPMLYQVMLFIIFTGLIGASFNTNASVSMAFPAFYLPLIAFLMYALLQHEEGQVGLALLFLIYVTAMHTSSIRFYNRLTQTLRLQLENEKLADSLAHSNKQLTRLAEIDPLTQTFNRRSMDRFLSDEWKTHLQSTRALSVLFIDIDYFKQYNDTYGHVEGDRCLSAVAQTLKKSIRSERDMVARYGGEEFAVILPNTECQEARHIAERILEDIQALRIMHTASSVADKLTVSIGITTMVPDPLCDVPAILNKADKALYDAKRSGRNRIVCDTA